MLECVTYQLDTRPMNSILYIAAAIITLLTAAIVWAIVHDIRIIVEGAKK